MYDLCAATVFGSDWDVNFELRVYGGSFLLNDLCCKAFFFFFFFAIYFYCTKIKQRKKEAVLSWYIQWKMYDFMKVLLMNGDWAFQASINGTAP